ncbi:MAG: phosphoribosylanthranilate isomerase [Chitinophagaceae bacterium]|nr:phosphoribosylanthranilate isomerase [Chitinophagaceae bacterium]
MKVKVCGLKFEENILDIVALQPDFIGFIFYEKSPRYVKELDENMMLLIPKQIKKVGVFVNTTLEQIITKFKQFKLDIVQLHGNESVDFCKILSQQNIPIIKAFSIDKLFDLSTLEAYQKYCQYFLFDTPTKNYGGSGKTFNWEVLKNYKLNTAFFLSGGIGVDNIEDALNFNHPQLLVIDLNSKLEEAPGFKNLQTTKYIIHKIRNYGTV